MQSKQLSRNDLAVDELVAVAIKCVETWYPTIKYDDSWRHCVNRRNCTALYGTNGEKNTLNWLLDLPFIANKVRTFPNYHLCAYFNLIWVKSCGAF